MAETEHASASPPVAAKAMQKLASSIASTRSEIEGLRAAFGVEGMRQAFSDLDDIVAASEEASLVILEAAERIQQAAARPGAGGEIQERALAIITACCFQDLTAQRIGRLKRLLREATYHIATLGQVWEVAGFGEARTVPKDTRPDAHLLHGPAARVARG